MSKKQRSLEEIQESIDWNRMGWPPPPDEPLPSTKIIDDIQTLEQKGQTMKPMSNSVIKIVTFIGFAIVGLVVSLFIGGLVGGWMGNLLYGNEDSWEVGVSHGIVVGFVLYTFGVLGGFALWAASSGEQRR